MTLKRSACRESRPGGKLFGKSRETFLAVHVGREICGRWGQTGFTGLPVSGKLRVQSLRCTCCHGIHVNTVCPPSVSRSGKIAGKGEGRVTALRSRRAMSKRTATLWKARRRTVAAQSCNGRKSHRRDDAEAPAPSSIPEFLRAFPSVGSSTPDREQRHGSRRHPRRDAPSGRAEPPLRHTFGIFRDCADLPH